MTEREQDQQRLARWLLEWRLAQVLDGTDEATSATGEGNSPSEERTDWPVSALELEAPPAAGQVRLLSPELTGLEHPPLPVAILSSPTRGTCVVVPFSRFAEPALPGELALERDTAPLRVLCVWNHRTLSVAAVALSWVVDALQPPELADAQALLSHVQTEATLPSALRTRTGPPLLHPDDPRVTYRLRARLQMDDLQRRAVALYLDDRRDDALPRAAESPPDLAD